MTDRLAHKQTAALFMLLALGREVTNVEFRNLVGFAIDGKDRRALNDIGFVESRLVKRCYNHVLTEAGFAWCQEEFRAGRPPQPAPRSTLAPALYILLAMLDGYMERARVPLSEIFPPNVNLTPEEIETRIRNAYRKLARAPQDWVQLADLRRVLGNVPTKTVDEVLKDLSRTGKAHLTPRNDRGALTEADHAAAIEIGGEDNHRISIEAL